MHLFREGQKQYRFLSDKENPKVNVMKILLTVIQSVGVQRISFQTDFGIFLTNAFPLDSYSFMGVFPILNRWEFQRGGM